VFSHFDGIIECFLTTASNLSVKDCVKHIYWPAITIPGRLHVIVCVCVFGTVEQQNRETTRQTTTNSPTFLHCKYLTADV